MTATDIPTYSLTIDGQAVATGQTFDVLNPTDGSVVAACPEGDVALLDRAVAAARRALPDWSARPDAERVAALKAIADLLQQNAKELSALVTREQGKAQSGPGANLEAGGCVAWTRATAGLTLPEMTIQDVRKATSEPRGGRLGFRPPRESSEMACALSTAASPGHFLPCAVRARSVDWTIRWIPSISCEPQGTVWMRVAVPEGPGAKPGGATARSSMKPGVFTTT